MSVRVVGRQKQEDLVSSRIVRSASSEIVGPYLKERGRKRKGKRREIK